MKKKTKQLSRTQLRSEIRGLLIHSCGGMSNRAVARNLNCSHTTVSSVRQELIEANELETTNKTDTNWINHPHLIANPNILDNATVRTLRALRSDGVLDMMQERNLKSAVYAQQLLNQQRKRARKDFSLIKPDLADVRLICADIAIDIPEIPDNSVDLVLCDPPYSSDYLHLYLDLGKLIARTLTKHGNALVMCGQQSIDEKISALTTHLKYHWTISYIVSDRPTLLQHIGVTSSQKVILWLRRKDADKVSGDLHRDVFYAPHITTDERLKTHHAWEQSPLGFQMLLEEFSNVNDLVFDPCCGSGTTALGAISTGRKFVGVDIDYKHIETAKQRITQLIKQLEDDQNGHSPSQ